MTVARQLSFAAGEIAPALYARADMARYATGLRTCRNMIVKRSGGVTNRPGLQLVGEEKDSNYKARLIPFIFNDEQTYVLEFGGLVPPTPPPLFLPTGYIRFWKNGEAVTFETPDAWVEDHEYEVGDLVSYSGTNYYCRAAHTSGAPLYMPGETTNNLWYVLEGNIYEVPTPYSEDELAGLQYVQNADVVTLTHKSHLRMELKRYDDASWTLTNASNGPEIGTPTGLAVVPDDVGTHSYTYSVTAVSADGEEGYAASVAIASAATPGPTGGHTVSWDAVDGAVEYRLYLACVETGGVAGYIGTTPDLEFENETYPEYGMPDLSMRPPYENEKVPNGCPTAVGLFQQRLLLGNFYYYGPDSHDPELVIGSRIGFPHNFTFTFMGVQADDEAVNFSMTGRQVNVVRHMLDIGKLVILTSGAVWVINGDSAGSLTPTAINAAIQDATGAASLMPIVTGSAALYLQARGSVVRDLKYDLNADGYKGNDLTVFSSHLVDGYEIKDWAMQTVPDPVVWMVRSDGALLGMTYLPEHELIAWHRHDTDGGTLESVCVVPEGGEDRLYCLVARTMGRFIERMDSRLAGEDTTYLDCYAEYDGTNLGATTMTLTGGPPWTSEDDLTLMASAPFFVAGDVGNAIHLTGADGEEIRASITAYTSGTAVTVQPNRDVPASLQGVAVTTWGKAVDVIGGLTHLVPGTAVGVVGDGAVIASPNNTSVDRVTVSAGYEITLPTLCVKVAVGLPYLCDLETLDLEDVGGETLMDKKMLVNRVTLFVEATKGVFIGPKPPSDDATDPLERMYELKMRDEETYEEPTEAFTGKVNHNIAGEWNSNGRVFIRQVDPVPMTILAIAPAGLIPAGGGGR